MSRFGVVGAGVAGLSCARELANAGHDVVVLDKARGPGGRCATRRADEVRFDHGAQYFTARDPEFREAVARWSDAGAVAPWKGRLLSRSSDGQLLPLPDEPRWVGAPTMSAVGRHLAGDLEVRLATRVDAVERGIGWRLLGEGGSDLGSFDELILAVPAPQAAPLLAAVPALAGEVAKVRLSPCWATMARFAAPLDVDFDGLALDDDEVLSWVAHNDSKPGRETHASWTLHAAASWSARHVDSGPVEVAQQMLARLAGLIGGPLPRVLQRAAHRWLYALVTEPLGRPYVREPDAALGICGDWCIAPRVEAAWQSGTALARAAKAGAR